MDQKRGNARAFLSYLENSANNGLGEVLTSDCAIHVSAPFGRELAAGPDGARALNAAVSAFATSHRRYEDEFGEGNRLVLQTVNDSVQRGVWNGLFSDRLDLSVRGGQDCRNLANGL